MAAKRAGKAVVLLSGGVDSATAMAIVHAEGRDLYALSFDYGQRHQRELESAGMVAEFFGVKKHLVVGIDLRDIGGSALTSEIEVPKRVRSYELGVRSKNRRQNSELRTPSSELIPVTYVPARNTIFLSFALAWAEVLNAADIFIGANAVDYSGYPDCRPEYLRAFEEMANLATKASVEGKLKFTIRAPLVSMTKSEIIKKGFELGLDYSMTWSCYDPQKGRDALSETHSELAENTRDGFVPCGLCDSCRFRAKGFKEAGIEDPLTL